MHSETYIDGVWHPSVTTIIGAQPRPWLDAWREKWGPLAERKMKIASEIGTEFHRCVEQYLDTGAFTSASKYSKRITGMMESFIDWAVNVDGTVEATELKVVSKKYCYSGTLDCIIFLDEKYVR